MIPAALSKPSRDETVSGLEVEHLVCQAEPHVLPTADLPSKQDHAGHVLGNQDASS